LDWLDNSTDETSFRIERSLDGSIFTPLGSVPPDVTSFSDNTVTPDVLYYYQVFAVNVDVDSKPSNVIATYTLDTTPPLAPALTLPANGDHLDTHNVRFEWDPVPDMSGVTYRIVVTDMGNGTVLHDVSGITDPNISLLLYDADYEWTVTATDGAGNVGLPSEGAYCQVASADHMAPDTTVTAPNGGEELEGGSTFAITWYALDQDFTSTPELIIRIFFTRDNGASWEQIAQMADNPGVFNWQVPNISCTETCLIRVTTENRALMIGSDASDYAFSIFSSSADGGVSGTSGTLSSKGGGGGAGSEYLIAALALLMMFRGSRNRRGGKPV
jgi:hypothetical protein